jgi:hypothetical protein
VGAYVTVRGWIEGSGELFDQARRIVRAEADADYGGGWGFPERMHNGLGFAFYGAVMRESGLDCLLRQVRMIAAVPPDEDGYHLVGLFFVSHEVDGMSEWQLRGGEVHVRTGPGTYGYLDE